MTDIATNSLLYDQLESTFPAICPSARLEAASTRLRNDYENAKPYPHIVIYALEHARSSGACLIVFAWPAFWWLSHYADFSRHIRTNFRCLVETEGLTIFDLRP